MRDWAASKAGASAGVIDEEYGGWGGDVQVLRLYLVLRYGIGV